MASTVSITPLAEGSGSGSVTYRATGLNRSNVTITRDDVLSVSWHAGPCTPPDTTPPSSSASAADSDGGTYAFGEWSGKDVTVALSAHDDGGSGLEEIRYTLDGSTPGPGQGRACTASRSRFTPRA